MMTREEWFPMIKGAQVDNLVRPYLWGYIFPALSKSADGIGGLIWGMRHDDHGITHHETFDGYDGNENVMGQVFVFDGSLVARYGYGPFALPLRVVGFLIADYSICFRLQGTLLRKRG